MDIRMFDAFPKMLDEARSTSKIGGAMTILSTLLIVWMTFGAISEYTHVEELYDVTVDTSRTEQQVLEINLDFTIAMKCDYFSVDIQDVTGQHNTDVDYDLQRTPVKWDYELKPEELNTYSTHNKIPITNNFLDVMRNAGGAVDFIESRRVQEEAQPVKIVAIDANEKGEFDESDGGATSGGEHDSCRLFGVMRVKKVKGNFHIAAGASVPSGHSHAHDTKSVPSNAINFTHAINRFSFGRNYPGIVNPLDRLVQHTDDRQMMYQYYITVVPTVYTSSSKTIDTNQYSVTLNQRSIDHNQGRHGLPGMFFTYDLAAVRVSVSRHTNSFGHFLTQLCAIIGGTFAVSGMISQFMSGMVETIADRGKNRRPGSGLTM